MAIIAAALPALAAAGSAVAAAAPALGTIGTVVSAGGAVLGGIAAGNAANYQAKVAENNAQIASQNADYAREVGGTKAEQAGLRAAEQGGAVKTALAANNVDVNSGSALDVEAGTAQKGVLDEETTVNNAELTAYGYTGQETGFEAQAGLDKAQAEQAPIGAAIGATGSFLSNSSAVAGIGKWIGGAGGSSPITNTMNASGSSVAGA